MSITLSHDKARYLDRVRAELIDISEEEREEIVQDLAAHLAELDDSEIVEQLGDPGVFAAEFRRSAGLEGSTGRPDTSWKRIRRTRARLDTGAARLASVTRWAAVRPTWVLVRGWLLVSLIAGRIESEPFRHFPIPSIGNRTTVGLLLVSVATWLSVSLDRTPRTEVRGAMSAGYSAITGLLLMTAVVIPISLSDSQRLVLDESYLYFDRLTTADGEWVNNIYAYDPEGNPVQVLLFDSGGRPLLNLPAYVYEDAELNPGASEIHHDNGAVRFERDAFGRIIPNLYPLQLLVYDDFGRLGPAAAPSLGLGEVGDPDRGTATDDPSPITTITRGE
jgi:hypothetical protein